MSSINSLKRSTSDISVKYFQTYFWVYLGVRTCELFLCFVAIVRVRVFYVDFFTSFLCFTSLVSFTGSYTEAEPYFSQL